MMDRPSPECAHDGPHPIEDLWMKENSADDECNSHSMADVHHYSTLSRFPPELVAEIFLECMDVECVDVPETREVLCQVCRAWKQIALSTPGLWTSISLVVSDERFDEQMTRLRTCFDRAGTLPLSVVLVADELFVDHDPVEALIPYLSRIRVMCLQLPGSCFQTICGLPDGSLQSLQQFNFCVGGLRGYLTSITTFGVITVFESAPSLRDFVVFDDNTLDTRGLRLPPQLTSLALSFRFSPTEFLGVLEACPNLESVIVAIRPPDSSTPQNAPSVTVSLPHCQKLILRIYSESALYDYPALTTFKLEHLGVRCPWNRPWPHTFFMGLTSQSSCNLKTLVLERMEISTIQLIEFLGILPSLTDLQVIYAAIECIPLIHALQYIPGSSQNLVPTLQELVLVVDEDFSDFEVPFLIMLGSRCWWNAFAPHARLLVPASRRLRKAVVCVQTWERDMLVTSPQCISLLEKAGMIVEISHIVVDHEY